MDNDEVDNDEVPRRLERLTTFVMTYPIELLLFVLVSGVFGVAHFRASNNGSEPWMRSRLGQP